MKLHITFPSITITITVTITPLFSNIYYYYYYCYYYPNITLLCKERKQEIVEMIIPYIIPQVVQII